MFSQACVKNSVHGGGGGVCSKECWDTPPWADTPSSQHYGIRSTIGRYASYWNAFLLLSTMKLRRLCFYRCVGWYPSMPCRWYPSMPCSRSPKGGEVCCLLLGGVETPRKKQTATVADGTHPTGMHSSC